MGNAYLNSIAISIEKQGPSAVTKASFPLRYGKYSEIKTSEYEFRFNLNGEIKFIRKPVSSTKVQAAFQKMLTVNATYTNIEITGNFLIGQTLSPEHYQSLTGLLKDPPAPSHKKGAIYLSPIKDSPKKRELLPQFLEIKKHSRLPTYIYLIQRL